MKPLRTIIVDDMRLIRAELKLLLSEFPEIEIVGEAASARKAINLISELEPDLVLLDIHLPRMSGFDILDQVTTHLNVIFITSYSNEFSEEAKKYKPVDFLMKPIRKEKLLKALKKLSPHTQDRNKVNT
jgi:two-component system LytT family response regulator